MKLDSFFRDGQLCRAVSPRPYTVSAFSRSNVLPGGAPNPSKQQRVARVLGCFVFVGGDVMEEARAAAWKHLRDEAVRRSEEKDPPEPLVLPTESDFNIEYSYQLLWRVFHEWDDASKCALDDRQFPTVNVLRECVVLKEADRALAAYFKYVDDEHPEAMPDAKTFRGSEGAGPGAPGKKPR